jgi:hypothetical protein
MLLKQIPTAWLIANLPGAFHRHLVKNLMATTFDQISQSWQMYSSLFGWVYLDTDKEYFDPKLV